MVAATATVIAMALSVILSGCVSPAAQDNNTNSTIQVCDGIAGEDCICPNGTKKTEFCNNGQSLCFTRGIVAHYNLQENLTLETCESGDFCYVCTFDYPICELPEWQESCANLNMAAWSEHYVDKQNILIKECGCITSKEAEDYLNNRGVNISNESQ